MSSFSSWYETVWDHSPKRQNFSMAEVVKTAITVNQCRQELFAGLRYSHSDLHILSSITFALHMTYWLNNQGIVSPHHTFVLRVRYNVIPGIFVLTLLSLSNPLLFLYYSTQWCLCLPFWTAEQKMYPKQINPPLYEEMSLLHIQIRNIWTEMDN